MARKLFRNWSIGTLPPALYAERDDAAGSVLDRWVGTFLGWFALSLSPVRRLHLRLFAAQVRTAGAGLLAATDEELRRQVQALRHRLLTRGLTRRNVCAAFALVSEVSFRQLGKRHYPVQLMGGYALLRGGIAEMATGEGKTLTATLPAITVALAGVPVHVVTVNEYLAARDAAALEPLFGFFGLSVGWISPAERPDERRAAYACDITYCVGQELVFDYLRDHLDRPSHSSAGWRPLARFLHGEATAGTHTELLRGLYFAIVDEVDSLFIDEARTPLIIARETAAAGAATWRAALEIARQLAPEAYVVLPRERVARLTAVGRDAVERSSRGMPGAWRFRKAREELAEQALAAQHLYQRDMQYIVSDGKVRIVDEFTGRCMDDRSWERGLHQLIELKEGLKPSSGRDSVARITYPRFFRRYLWLAGMTGTGAEVAPELRSVLGLATLRIPTHRRLARRAGGDRVFVSAAVRWNAVVSRVIEMRAAGRAILIGTRSVAASEALSALLMKAGVEHALLNARQLAEEALIIAAAGRPGRVTVATNMAGRGTDILLDSQVRAAGGLHVILTEYHESRRIDRQLFGRAGRQGDPGSYESLTSLDDDLFAAHAPWAARRLRVLFVATSELPRCLGSLLRIAAQAAADQRHARIRASVLRGETHSDRSLAFAGRRE
jgi:preprotein translocase subunit SecA